MAEVQLGKTNQHRQRQEDKEHHFQKCLRAIPAEPVGAGQEDIPRHRAPPSSDRVTANAKGKAARPPSRGSVAVGLAFAAMVGLAFRLNHRQAANGPELASERISLVLDLEDPSRRNRTTSNRE